MLVLYSTIPNTGIFYLLRKFHKLNKKNRETFLFLLANLVSLIELSQYVLTYMGITHFNIKKQFYRAIVSSAKTITCFSNAGVYPLRMNSDKDHCS